MKKQLGTFRDNFVRFEGQIRNLYLGKRTTFKGSFVLKKGITYEWNRAEKYQK